MGLEYNSAVQYIKGVGPKLGDLLRRRGVSTVSDLLDWFPRAYEDRRHARNIASLQQDQTVSLEATVLSVRSINMGRSHRKMYDVVIGDGSGRIACKFFRVPYKGYFERFATHQKVRVAGKVTLYRGRLEFHHPDLQPVFEDEELEAKDILIPLYTETEGISPTKLRKILETALNEVAIKTHQIPDVFPSWLRQKYNLLSREQALKDIHQPPTEQGELFLNFKAPAQRRVIFEEFFWLELYMAKQKFGLKRESAPAFLSGRALASKMLDHLPFTLTGAQKKAIEEIYQDLQQPHPMHRLVQGDVGSGKTLVAFVASAFCIESGYQAALMAPTEILAEQHFKNAQKFLAPLNLRLALLTGKSTEKEHQKICQALRAGEIDFLIGTHALIEEGVDFKALGLVVIDEQHRFGVEQRNRLKKNTMPHFLVMTATPIPRTLAMTVYGDLDVSTIDELPPGRSPIVTRKVFSSKRDQVFQFMKEQVDKGRQAYIVYPLVEESEKIDLKNALEEFESLKNRFPDIRFGLLHGKMKSAEKETTMNEFRAGTFQVLVSTTVIEVGVDVPNANLIIIEHAERFGLSQLHQLRGRVGRGEHKSYCVLVLGYAVSEDSIHRADVIVSTTDGFKIAEADLEIRGPGEFLGRRQSGMPGFKMANLVRDLRILQEARQAALELLQRDPMLSVPEHRLIYDAMNHHEKSIVG